MAPKLGPGNMQIIFVLIRIDLITMNLTIPLSGITSYITNRSGWHNLT